MRRLALFVGLMSGQVASAGKPSSKAPVELYGFVRLDTIFDTRRMSHPHFPMWVAPATDRARPEFALHPRLSRVGVRLLPRTTGELTVRGKVEIDFQNGGKESRSLLRMRDAWAEFRYRRLRVGFGQTSDLISPLAPSANNDGVMWNAGNLGDRRPSVRADLRLPVGGGELTTAVALGMTGAVDGQDLDDNGRLDGVDAGVPSVSSSVELRLPTRAEADLRLGLWAHLGTERVEHAVNTESVFYGAAVGAHAVVPIWGSMRVQTELFLGQDLSDVRGGIGQGVNREGRAIRSVGGWAEITSHLAERWTIGLGASTDSPFVDDVDDGGRLHNRAVWLAQRFTIAPATTLGLEYVYWTTENKGVGVAAAHRFNAHCTYRF